MSVAVQPNFFDISFCISCRSNGRGGFSVRVAFLSAAVYVGGDWAAEPNALPLAWSQKTFLSRSLLTLGAPSSLIRSGDAA